MALYPSVNSERLWQRLMQIARIGATEKGGCNRQALSDEDKTGRELFIAWCRDAGCDIRIDAIGNVFARRAGSQSQAAAVMTGSHLDTQVTGGKFDGIYGVLAGLEVIETLNDAAIETRHPIEVVVWTNEEGCRFDTAMMGSAVWSGAMSLEDAYALTDRSGNNVRDELLRIGYLGSLPSAPGAIKAAFELHIEQGPVLEANHTTIGVVTRVQHMSRHRIVVYGQETHAGPTPMAMRKDPMMAVAQFLPQLYQLAAQYSPDSRITLGFIEAQPGSGNTVPGRVELTVDIRHPHKASYDAMVAACQQLVRSACEPLGMDFSCERFWHAPGIEFAQDCINSVREAVAATGYSSMELCSGAGHDACNLQAVVPTSMIFIPCENGISHNEAESASPEHVAAGANVLLHAILGQARR